MAPKIVFPEVEKRPKTIPNRREINIAKTEVSTVVKNPTINVSLYIQIFSHASTLKRFPIKISFISGTQVPLFKIKGCFPKLAFQ